MLAGVKKTNSVYLAEDGTAERVLAIHTPTQRIVVSGRFAQGYNNTADSRDRELFRYVRTFDYRFSAPVGAKKILIFNPVPLKVYHKETSRVGELDNGMTVGEYQIYTGGAFLRMLERSLAEMAAGRLTQRQARDRSGLSRVAIVGYTNAGKSTLLNYLTDAGILARDQLFATLDPTTRQCKLPGGETVLLTDTVGFIRNLPHHLVHAFRSTLEEAVYADLLLIVVDASDKEAAAQLTVTEELLQSLGAGGKPTLYVFNKCDLGAAVPGLSRGRENTVYISAATGQGVDAMMLRLEEMLHEGKRRVTFLFPADRQGLVAKLYANATVESVEYLPQGTRVVATVDAKTYGPLRDFDLDYTGESDDE
jgi:GTP-binding protein HflX